METGPIASRHAFQFLDHGKHSTRPALWPAYNLTKARCELIRFQVPKTVHGPCLFPPPMPSTRNLQWRPTAGRGRGGIFCPLIVDSERFSYTWRKIPRVILYVSRSNVTEVSSWRHFPIAKLQLQFSTHFFEK